MDTSATAYRRVHANEDEVTVVRQMPRAERAQQPTIAVITSQYHEKLAVDAVMTNKQTFVRYATVGEFEEGASQDPASVGMRAIFVFQWRDVSW